MKRVIYPALIITGIAIIVLNCISIFNQLNEHQIRMQFSNDEATIYRLKEHLVERILKVQSDTVFVASYVGDKLNGYNTGSPNESEKIKEDLMVVIPSLFKTNSIFYCMYYIGTVGNDSFSMCSSGLNKEPLPDKSVRSDYLRRTSALGSGGIYTSFDSNFIYVCSPVYNESGAFSGSVVFVVKKDELLNELRPFMESGNIILMEDTGKYIMTSQKHSGKTGFSDEYPGSLLTDMVSSQSGNLTYDNALLTYAPVQLDDRLWLLLLSTDKESSLAEYSALYQRLVIILGLVIVAILAAVVFWLNSNKKDQIAKQEKQQKLQLEDVNRLLQEKQYTLEEQNAFIEELNSQLADENALFLEQKEILQAIVDSLGAGIIMVDEQGELVFINKAWRDFFNYVEFGKNLSTNNQFYINNDTYGDIEEFFMNILSGIEKKDELFKELHGLTKDGESRFNAEIEQTSPMGRFINLYSNPCISSTNHSFGRVYVVRDISHQKEVDRLKLELISTVSHELRTPMSSILGFSELLLTRTLTEARSKEYIGIIHSEAKRLTELINNFLDIQRMESGRQAFNKQYNSLSSIIEESVQLFGDPSGRSRIVCDESIQDIPLVLCDRDKIMQVLSNLLSNAIKYSPDGGDININAELSAGRVGISISDHGLGIPEEAKDKLFTKFFRVDNDDRRKIGGSGLGLAICKEIIRAHDGDIGADSVYGQGSTFYFYLPYSTGMDENKEYKLKHKYKQGANGNLLIVEDDPSIVKLIKEVLKDEDLGMHDVSSGEEALALAGKYPYKLIILDISLSGQMNGWDVLKELKNNPSTQDTPIIISSVYENKDIASERGVADYLVKPFEPGQLVYMVQKASVGKLNSKVMVKNGDGITDAILDMLSSKNIGVRHVEHSGNILIITLDSEEGLENE